MPMKENSGSSMAYLENSIKLKNNFKKFIFSASVEWYNNRQNVQQTFLYLLPFFFFSKTPHENNNLGRILVPTKQYLLFFLKLQTQETTYKFSVVYVLMCMYRCNVVISSHCFFELLHECMFFLRTITIVLC